MSLFSYKRTSRQKELVQTWLKVKTLIIFCFSKLFMQARKLESSARTRSCQARARLELEKFQARNIPTANFNVAYVYEN